MLESIQSRSKTLGLGLAAGALLALAGWAGWAGPAKAADDYPDRPITIVVPYSAGGNGDTIARLLSPGLSQRLGQPIVIDNKPGVGGLLGSALVARAEPDGYTLLLTSNAQAINVSLYDNGMVDLIGDFAPIGETTEGSTILVVKADSPFKSVDDIVQAAKAAPNSLTYASSGNGSTQHVAMALFNKKAGVETKHIPYKGASQATTDLLAGRVDMAFINSSTALNLISSGQARGIGASSPKRSPLTNDMPVIAETLPDFQVRNWQALVAPKGTPEPVIDTLSKALRETLEDSEVKEALAKLGVEAAPSTPQQLADLTGSEVERWKQVIADAGMKVQQ